MKVPLLEKSIERFISDQLTGNDVAWYYPHEIVRQFNDHWSVPEPSGLASIYDHCLHSEISQRWWKREKYQPKEMMLSLIHADPELATLAWKDLANDASGLDGRLSRFDYYCNDLLQTYRQKPPGSLESYHYQDAAMISLYLAGLFPGKYALYPGLSVFKNFCKEVGSPDIPVIDDLVRYMKVANVVNTFLQKNSAYENLLALRAEGMHKISVIPYLLTYEVIFFTGNPNRPLQYGF
jgi:hypothetical protein